MVDTKERKQFIFDCFIGAMEGGIGYWSSADSYHWTTGTELDNEDLDGFYAVIRDLEDDDKKYRITPAIIKRGINRLISGKATGLHSAYRAQIAGAYAISEDNGELDATHYDAIVQAGLFGEVRYG